MSRFAFLLFPAALLAQYPGAEPDAPWRAAAASRIDQIRKAPLTITVTDAAGRPLPNTPVELRQLSHAFGFGTAVAAQQLLAESPDAERYRRTLLDNFNMVVFENDLKWPQWLAGRDRPLRALDWLNANGITRVRGHVLVWPGWRWLPKDLRTLENDPEALRNRVLGRIEDTVSATRGRLVHWDVLNEPFTNHDLLDILGFHEMVAWFKTARAHDPDVRLYINDFNILSGNDAAHRDHYYRTILYLQGHGAPLNGIGLQGHFTSPVPPEEMLRRLDRFASFKLPLAITEFDFNTRDAALQAQFTRDFLTLAFSHPAVTDFLMWGFWEGRHWRPDAAMFLRDWTPKPNHAVWRDLVYGQWWTHATLTTNASGQISTRAFLGDYQITSGSASRRLTLSTEGAALTLKP